MYQRFCYGSWQHCDCEEQGDASVTQRFCCRSRLADNIQRRWGLLAWVDVAIVEQLLSRQQLRLTGSVHNMQWMVAA
jgi:hypothetical protein